METVTIPKEEYEGLKQEVRTLKNTQLYKELLAFQKSVAKNGEFTRQDLGF